ncbi:T9SS type A sorting domain-containing protein [Winogradskyella eckloniae]|uniref:chondroitinase-B domain-containing protein n=1 Tax=Winogradskyella eckloniae TaxID=1089306 RepID=UPI0015636F53|nr:chondroitinase-B domain-containing protein [Winogradskyella eckloniae]NRD19724.1 T9SS type A sorting domain-containing protein [Winogradskyella eckloniae]
MKTFYVFKSRMYFLIILLLMTSLFTLNAQTTYNISDPEDLEDQSYVPGDVIILANGIYDSDERIDFVGNGTAANPIVFRAETPGGVKFTGGLQMNIGGDYVVVDGFHWQGGYGASNFIQFRNGFDYANHSTIQNCAIDGLEIHPDDVADDIADGSITKHRWIVLYGTYNSVLNCSFMNKESAGALILAEYAYNATPDEGVTNTRCDIVGHTISNNYFYNYVKIDNTLSNSGDSETIRIGTSEYQNVNSNATVSNNYFVKADGENEIITNKSKNNSYINNTFRRCRGSLVLRHGSNAIVEGNYFLGENIDGTGGIRITDSEHLITNNYIQDCITVVSQAKWNNGVTFLGGSANNSVACTSTSVSNGYQKSENITVSNNTIINTNAPLFYNTDKGSTDPTGSVTNNLIYFTTGNANITDVITGDTATSYADLGTTLNYTGNVYTGSALGETNAGFSEESGITATADGEIFTFSGTGSAGKGADMGSYLPITDDMVGYGIGACFLDNLGSNIIDGNCNIEIPESLTVGSLDVLDAEAGSYDVSVYANVSWTAVSNDSWISIDVNASPGDATVAVTVTENTDVNARTGSVTFSQDPGGDDIVRVLNVSQEGADLTDLYDLINDVAGGGPVSIHAFSSDNASDSPPEIAINTLDKVNTSSSIWAAQDGSVISGDYKGDGEYIIYDLGSEYNLDLIQFSTTNKSDAFGYQIWVSTNGTNDADFTKILPETEDLLLTATNTMDFNQYQLSTPARYVKMIGFGRFNSAGDTRTSAWSTIAEIEFFGSEALSINESDFDKNLQVYPIPAAHTLNINVLNDIQIETVKIIGLDGKLILNLNSEFDKPEFSIDISKLSKGTYILNLSNATGLNLSKFIVKD